MEVALTAKQLWPFSTTRDPAKSWPMRSCCAGKATASTHEQMTKEKKVEQFTAWLQGMGHDPCNLLLHNFPSASATPGFATTAGPGGIRKGQVVVQVPLQAFMSEQATYLGPIGCNSNKALLNAIGLPSDGAVFSITEAGVDDSVLAWTRAAVASTKELADAGWSEELQSGKWVCNRAASAMAHFHQPVSQENESEVLRRLLSACGTILTQYPTSLDEDLRSLGNVVKVLPWAQVQAQRASVAEKTALRAAWKHLYVLSERLKKGVLGQKPCKKKRKKELQKSMRIKDL